MKLEPYLIPLTKINSEWIKHLNIRPETINLLEKNIGVKLLDTDLGKEFLDTIPKAQATKTKIIKWYYTKLKSFCTAKETINQMKRQLMEWENVFANLISDLGLISNIYIRNSYNSTAKQKQKHTNNVILK